MECKTLKRRASHLVVCGITIIAALTVMVSCSSTPDTVAESKIDVVMERWYSGLTAGDLDLMVSAYHADAVLHGLGPEGPVEIVGIDAIREAQAASMENDWTVFDYSRADDRAVEGANRAYALSIPGEVTLVNSFVFDREDNSGLIVEQWIEVFK